MSRPLAVLLSIVAGVSGLDVEAQQRAPAYDAAGPAVLTIDSSVIDGGAMANIHGRTAVNLSAGNANVQDNAAAIALGASRAGAQTRIRQITDAVHGGPSAAFVFIGDGAFAAASGLLSINQASGTGNAQANAAAITFGGGVEVTSDTVLAGSTSASRPSVSASGPPRMRSVSISPTAFENARGLVQVNQSAGTANSTANSFALQVQTGAAGQP